jgi:hypothetical protein
MENYFDNPTVVRIEAMRDDIVKYIEHQIKLDDTGLTMSVEFTKEIMKLLYLPQRGCKLLTHLHHSGLTNTHSTEQVLITRPSDSTCPRANHNP